MPTQSRGSPRVFRAHSGALSVLFVLPTAAVWLYWFRHRGDLGDEASNRLAFFFAVVLSIIAIAIIINALLEYPKLVLTAEGIEIRSLLSRRKYFWSDDYEFEIRETGGFKKIAFHQRGSDMEGDIQLKLYDESAEEILQALREGSKSRANGA